MTASDGSEGPARPSLASDLKEVQHHLSLVLLFATLPTMCLWGLVSKLTGIDEAFSLGRLIAATAPLTAAVTLVGIAALSGKFGLGELAFGSAVALLGSVLLGSALGRKLPIDPTQDLGGIPSAIVTILGGYYRLYGGWSFATSFVAGGFLAWAWSSKFAPRIDFWLQRR